MVVYNEKTGFLEHHDPYYVIAFLEALQGVKRIDYDTGVPTGWVVVTKDHQCFFCDDVVLKEEPCGK